MDESTPRLQAEVDVDVPSAARVYDYMLGGKDNFASDRVVGDQLFALEPNSRRATQENRDVLGRAVRFLAEQGIDQFVDIGSGLPTQQNVHHVAQEANPNAHVVYVDNDPIVLAHGRALLAQNSRTTVIQADMRDPEALLNDPRLTALIDLDRPVGLILCGVLHHLDDAEDPQGLVRAFTDRLASGSHVFITHFARSGAKSSKGEEILMSGIGSGRFRTADEIAELFDGLDLVEPGVVYVPQWRPEGPVEGDLDDWQKLLMGGVAGKR